MKLKDILNSEQIKALEHVMAVNEAKKEFSKYEIEEMAYELVGDKAINKVLTKNKVDKRDADTMYYVLMKAIEILKRKT